jgi:hypothetical protein
VAVWLAVAGAVATAATYVILAQTSTVVWSIFGLFVAAMIYASLFQAIRTYFGQRIESIAIVLKTTPAGSSSAVAANTITPAEEVTGGLVAETDSLAYVAIRNSNGSWAVRRIDLSNVAKQAVGPLTKKRDVVNAANRLLASLTR